MNNHQVIKLFMRSYHNYLRDDDGFYLDTNPNGRVRFPNRIANR